MSDAFVDSIGVNAHFNDTSTPYFTRFQNVKNLISQAGIRHVRCGDDTGSIYYSYIANVRSLPSAGIKCLFTVSIDGRNGTLGAHYAQADFDAFVHMAGSAAEGFEAPNELDIANLSNWVQLARNSTRSLKSMMRANLATAWLPLVGPSMTNPNHYAQIGDLSSVVDRGNMHNYPAAGWTPETPQVITTWFPGVRTLSGSKPIWTTETAYCELPSNRNVPPTGINGIYESRLWLESFRDGVARTYKYEMINADDYGSGRFDRCGLVSNGLSPKIAYYMLKNEIATFTDKGSSFRPGTLSYNLGADPKLVHHLLLQKRDGTYQLVVWGADLLWQNGSQVTPATHVVPLTLPAARTISVRRFNANGTLTDTNVGARSSLTLNITDTPTVISIR